MLKIIGMTLEELLNLNPDDVVRPLTADEVVYMAERVGAFWKYNYAVAKEKPGYHARLKSEWHSDGFIVSKIILQFPNIKRIMANQIVLQLKAQGLSLPDYAGGIPDGATQLGEDVAEILGVKKAEMRKEEGRIVLVTLIPPGSSLLLLEDFCTKGTGFCEAVLFIKTAQPEVIIVPYEGVIINRGGLKSIEVEGVGSFEIISVVDYRVNDWPSDKCRLCLEFGSRPIKPKETEENWRLITTAQL